MEQAHDLLLLCFAANVQGSGVKTHCRDDQCAVIKDTASDAADDFSRGLKAGLTPYQLFQSAASWSMFKQQYFGEVMYLHRKRFMLLVL